MIASPTIECAYCGSSIVPGQRWARQKIYEPALNGREPRYHRYHAELFAGEDQSCWEKQQLHQDLTGNYRLRGLRDTEKDQLSQLALP